MKVNIRTIQPGQKFTYHKHEFLAQQWRWDTNHDFHELTCKNLTTNNYPCYFSLPDTMVEIEDENKNCQTKEDYSRFSKDGKLNLHLGCFHKPIPGFVNIDIRPYPETGCDVVDDILKLEKFEDGTADTILAVHVLEHVGRYEYMTALKTWFNKLKKGGAAYISVPDMKAVCEHYIYHHDLSFLYSFIWGSQKHKADWHGCGFDSMLLTKSLLEVGFSSVEPYDCETVPWAYCDSYAQAYAKLKDRSSRLMSLNLKATK